MNRPETQTKIRNSLAGYLRSFLDTAPDDGGPERVRELLVMVKRYFETELEKAESESDSKRISASELVLASLGVAIQRIPTDEQLEGIEANVLNSPPATREDVAAWERLERLLEREGKKGWWD
jgi:hypothetical protein